MFFCLAFLMVLSAGVATFATAINKISTGQVYFSTASQLNSHGAHCNGTVGCGCPGFSPITSGDVWQQSYCRHCSHHRRYHK